MRNTTYTSTYTICGFYHSISFRFSLRRFVWYYILFLPSQKRDQSLWRTVRRWKEGTTVPRRTKMWTSVKVRAMKKRFKSLRNFIRKAQTLHRSNTLHPGRPRRRPLRLLCRGRQAGQLGKETREGPAMRFPTAKHPANGPEPTTHTRPHLNLWRRRPSQRGTPGPRTHLPVMCNEQGGGAPRPHGSFN